MKLTAFDYFPWLRPFSDRWVWICKNQMSELLAAGGYRQKWAATAYRSPGFDASLQGAAAIDYYINIVPGSYCWGVTAYDDPATAFPAAPTPNVAVGQCATEFEIVDTSTRETWFESSIDACGLGAWNFNDNITVHDQGLNVDIIEQMGFYYNIWMLQQPRLILGNGVQRVRITQNSSASIDQQRGALVLWLLEPINSGVSGGF